MAERFQPIDLSSGPDLLRLVDEVVTTRKALRLQRDGQDVAVINPARPFAGRMRRRQIPLNHDDALWGIVGLIADDGPADVSSNKHRYLAEAYMPTRP